MSKFSTKNMFRILIVLIQSFKRHTRKKHLSSKVVKKTVLVIIFLSDYTKPTSMALFELLCQWLDLSKYYISYARFTIHKKYHQKPVSDVHVGDEYGKRRPS